MRDSVLPDPAETSVLQKTDTIVISGLVFDDGKKPGNGAADAKSVSSETRNEA